MSQINTNGINVNYPVPGTNNSSQGFRDNFTQIRTNLNTAATEITDLQNKVILKAALNDTVLNNNMGNTLISNASTSGFRATTYNLGTSLSGIVLVDVNRADVQYGTVTGNVTLQFGGWAPTNTESNVVLRFTVADPNVVISWPNEAVSSNNNFGITLLENYQDIAGVATVTAPAETEILEYTVSTLDCGDTLTVTPVNRPFQATQIVKRDPPPTGLPGDEKGAVAVGANYLYVCTDTFDSTVYQKTATTTTAAGNVITLTNTTNLVVNAPIIFSGNVDTANTNIVEDQVYYIKTIASPNVTVSMTRTGGTAGAAFVVGNSDVSWLGAAANVYVGTNIWKRIALTTW